MLEHSVGGGEFTSRGTLVVSSSKRGNRRVAKFEDAGKLGPTEVETFKESVRNEDVYRIRMRSRPDDSESPYVVASIPACQLLLGKFKEKILIRENEDGSVSSLEYANPYFHGDCAKLLSGSSKAKGNIRFKSAAQFVMPNEATPVRGVRVRSARTLVTSLKYHCIAHSCHCTLKNYKYSTYNSRLSSIVTKYLTRTSRSNTGTLEN